MPSLAEAVREAQRAQPLACVLTATHVQALDRWGAALATWRAGQPPPLEALRAGLAALPDIMNNRAASLSAGEAWSARLVPLPQGFVLTLTDVVGHQQFVFMLDAQQQIYSASWQVGWPASATSVVGLEARLAPIGWSLRLREGAHARGVALGPTLPGFAWTTRPQLDSPPPPGLDWLGDVLQDQLESIAEDWGEDLGEKALVPTAPQQSGSRACPQCGAANPPENKFCGDCGARLPSPTPAFCGHCGAPAQPGKKFCAQCGQAF